MKEAAGNLLLTSLSHIKEEKNNDTFQKFLLTLLIGGIALLSEFVFHQPALAFAIVAFTGGFSPS